VDRKADGEFEEFRSCRSSGVAGVQELQEFRSSSCVAFLAEGYAGRSASQT
jgi:hypothetical protein